MSILASVHEDVDVSTAAVGQPGNSLLASYSSPPYQADSIWGPSTDVLHDSSDTTVTKDPSSRQTISS